MGDLNTIYRYEADRYQALVSREDYQNHLLPAILSIDALTDKFVLELGAGTGRLSRLIAPIAGRLVVTDLSLHMLAYGQAFACDVGAGACPAAVATHWALPFQPASADLVIAGWSFCYAALNAVGDWRAGLEMALGEVDRVLRPGGKLILIESLGTGFETPHPPQVLEKYLAYLDDHGFKMRWIRTDYRFTSLEEAVSLTRFFFGDDPLAMRATPRGVVVPECTGLWWRELE